MGSEMCIRDRYEMAFEGLFIEIMQCKNPVSIDVKKSVAVAKSLQLDIESVFDANFWNHFKEFIG